MSSIWIADCTNNFWSLFPVVCQWPAASSKMLLCIACNKNLFWIKWINHPLCLPLSFLFHILPFPDLWKCSKYFSHCNEQCSETKSCSSRTHISGDLYFSFLVRMHYSKKFFAFMFVVLILHIFMFDLSVQWRSTVTVYKEIHDHHTSWRGNSQHWTSCTAIIVVNWILRSFVILSKIYLYLVVYAAKFFDPLTIWYCPAG